MNITELKEKLGAVRAILRNLYDLNRLCPIYYDRIRTLEQEAVILSRRIERA